jgi:hypothetical protein
MKSPRKRILIFIIFSFSIIFLQEQGFSQRPYRYSIELNSGQTILAVSKHYVPTYGYNEIIICDDCNPRTMILLYPDVKRILSIADPIIPPRIITWEEGDNIRKDTCCDTCWNRCNPPTCDCLGHDRTTASTFLDARLGINGKGSSSYTFSTANGPQTVTSTLFSPSNIGSTNLTFEGEVAGGLILGRFDVGLMLGTIPTDGFVYFPIGVHGRYYLADNCCSYTIFSDIGLPVGGSSAPTFISPITSDRQRKFFDIGIGKIWPFSESMGFAIDLGYRYMVIPLAEIQCCPTITGDNRFPARKSNAGFLQTGFSF